MSSKRTIDIDDADSTNTKVVKHDFSDGRSHSRDRVTSHDELESDRLRKTEMTDPRNEEKIRVNKTGLRSAPRNFDGPFPFFRQPREIGCLSIDSEMRFHNDGHQLKYYKPPSNTSNVSFDLRAGFQSWIKRDEEYKDYINPLLRWILCNKSKFLPPGEKDTEKGLFTDFICWRGLLTRLLCTPYENRDSWIIAVTKFKGTFYLCEFDTDEKIQQRENETEKQKELCYGGYKFEQYLCSPKPDVEPVTTEPVNSIEQFGLLVRGRLESHSLVFGGEVDCRDVSGKEAHYVELKTSREISHPKQDSSFKRFKLIKWWAQSFLIGIPKIVCGFRDDDGIVHRLQTFNTLQIPEYCQDIGNCWKSTVCFNFLNSFLKMVKETVTEDNPRVSYVFRWSPYSEVCWTKHQSPSKYHFLPEWYIDPSQQKETS